MLAAPGLAQRLPRPEHVMYECEVIAVVFFESNIISSRAASSATYCV
jgi:hypothetical protein